MKRFLFLFLLLLACVSARAANPSFVDSTNIIFANYLSGSNTLFVDPNGNNNTARRGMREKAWRTLWGIHDKTLHTYYGALTNAGAGDTIVLLPGVHFAPAVPLNLGANGVNLWVMPGAHLIRGGFTNQAGVAIGGLVANLSSSPFIIPGNGSRITVDGSITATNSSDDATIGWRDTLVTTVPFNFYGFTNVPASNVVISGSGVLNGAIDNLYFSQTNTAIQSSVTLANLRLTGTFDYLVGAGNLRLITKNLSGLAGAGGPTMNAEGVAFQPGVSWTDFGSVFGSTGGTNFNIPAFFNGATGLLYGTKFYVTTTNSLPGGTPAGSTNNYFYASNSIISGDWTYIDELGNVLGGAGYIAASAGNGTNTTFWGATTVNSNLLVTGPWGFFKATLWTNGTASGTNTWDAHLSGSSLHFFGNHQFKVGFDTNGVVSATAFQINGSLGSPSVATKFDAGTNLTFATSSDFWPGTVSVSNLIGGDVLTNGRTAATLFSSLVRITNGTFVVQNLGANTFQANTDGDVNFTGVANGSGAGLTNLPATNIIGTFTTLNVVTQNVGTLVLTNPLSISRSSIPQNIARYAFSPTQGTISSNEAYQAWPALVSAVDTNLLYLFFGGNNAHVATTSSRVMMTVSTNAGSTWGPNMDVITNGTFSVANFSAGADSSGRLYVLNEAYPMSGAAITTNITVRISDDYGVTWTSLTTLTNPNVSALSARYVPHKRIIEQDGTLYTSIYTPSTNATWGATYCARSSNRGTNWTYSLISSNSSIDLDETMIIGFGRGVLYAAARVENNVSYGRAAFFTSIDRGATWTFNGYGLNQLTSTSANPLEMVLDNAGNIVLFTTDRITQQVLAFTLPVTQSGNGTNWNTAASTIVATGVAGGYCSAISGQDNRMLVSWYDDNHSSAAPANVYLTNFIARSILTTNLSTMAPDFGGIGVTTRYSWISTNAAFAFLAPIGIDPSLPQTSVLFVTNTTAAAIAVTAPSGVHTQGTWYITNLTSFTFFKYGNYYTNAIALPLF